MTASLSPLVILAIALGWLCAFVLFWVMVVSLLAWISGWRALAARYRDLGLRERYSRQRVSGSLRGVGYNHVLRVHQDTHCLYLAVHPLFRIGHPPLRIPWREIERREERNFRGWPRTRLRLGRPPVADLVLPGAVLDAEPS